MPLINISGPSGEPVTAAEVKQSARIDGSEFDAEIVLLIAAARADVEARLGRRLITQVVELVLDDFPAAEIDLRLPDVQSIVGVNYIDAAGAGQVLPDTIYALDATSTPCWLLPADGTAWPVAHVGANAVRVRFNVGYGDTANDVPVPIRQWIIATVAAEINKANVSRFVDGLIDPFKVYA